MRFFNLFLIFSFIKQKTPTKNKTPPLARGRKSFILLYKSGGNLEVIDQVARVHAGEREDEAGYTAGGVRSILICTHVNELGSTCLLRIELVHLSGGIHNKLEGILLTKRYVEARSSLCLFDTILVACCNKLIGVNLITGIGIYVGIVERKDDGSVVVLFVIRKGEELSSVE